MQVEMVVEMSEVSLFTNESRASLIRLRNPPASMMPLNIMAIMMSHTVFNIPSIPRVDNSESISGAPVDSFILPNMV